MLTALPYEFLTRVAKEDLGLVVADEQRRAAGIDVAVKGRHLGGAVAPIVGTHHHHPMRLQPREAERALRLDPLTHRKAVGAQRARQLAEAVVAGGRTGVADVAQMLGAPLHAAAAQAAGAYQRDNFGRPYGGNVLVASQLELIIPVPEKFRSQARASLFYDIGNVFSTGEVSFTDKLGSPVEYKPEFDELRTSVGVAVQWLAPLGLFRFSYAYPLNEFKGNDRFYGDRIERFQFSIGQAF